MHTTCNSTRAAAVLLQKKICEAWSTMTLSDEEGGLKPKQQASRHVVSVHPLMSLSSVTDGRAASSSLFQQVCVCMHITQRHTQTGCVLVSVCVMHWILPHASMSQHQHTAHTHTHTHSCALLYLWGRWLTRCITQTKLEPMSDSDLHCQTKSKSSHSKVRTRKMSSFNEHADAFQICPHSRKMSPLCNKALPFHNCHYFW